MHRAKDLQTFSAPTEEEAKGDAPSFVSKPKIIPSEDGSLITLQCLVKCKPAPAYVWRQDGKEVSSGGRVTITMTPEGDDVYKLQLEIRVNYKL